MKHTMPAARPIKTLARTVTKPHAGVIATNPATAPEAAPKALALPRANHSASDHASPAAAAAKCVLQKALTAVALASKALPALKPNQPTHSRAAPRNV